jgi:hypothetical protein
MQVRRGAGSECRRSSPFARANGSCDDSPPSRPILEPTAGCDKHAPPWRPSWVILFRSAPHGSQRKWRCRWAAHRAKPRNTPAGRRTSTSARVGSAPRFGQPPDIGSGPRRNRSSDFPDILRRDESISDVRNGEKVFRPSRGLFDHLPQVKDVHAEGMTFVTRHAGLRLQLLVRDRPPARAHHREDDAKLNRTEPMRLAVVVQRAGPRIQHELPDNDFTVGNSGRWRQARPPQQCGNPHLQL